MSRALGRDPLDCQVKWNAVYKASLKTGPFSAAEDEAIVRRTKEWGDKGPGLWTSLEKELGRAAGEILARSKHVLKKL